MAITYQQFLADIEGKTLLQVIEYYQNAGSERGRPTYVGWYYDLNIGGAHYLDTVIDPKVPWSVGQDGFQPDAVQHVKIPPKRPNILSPTIGSEVSNLDPYIRIRHTEAVDQLRHEVELGLGSSLNMAGADEGYGPIIGPQGIYTYFKYDRSPQKSGRPVKIRIPVEVNPNATGAPPLGGQDVKFTIYRVQVDSAAPAGTVWESPANKDQTPYVRWTKKFEGFVPTGKHIVDVPYDQMFRNGGDYTVIHIQPVSRTDIVMMVDSVDSGQSDEQYYYYDTAWKAAPRNAGSNIPNISMILTSGHRKDMTYHYELSLDNGSSWTSLGYLSKTGGTGYIVGGGLMDPEEKRTLYAADGDTQTGNTLSSFTTEIDANGNEFYNVNLNISALLESGQETYQARVRVRGQDDNGSYSEPWWVRYDNYSDWTESEGVFSIIKHIPPSKPINLVVSDTGIIDKNISNRLSWKYVQNSMNNRQGRALIQWRLQGETVWNEISVTGLNTFYDVPANTFPLGTIEWQVKTWNSVDMEGPFSDIQTFIVKDTPIAPTIAAPVGEAEVTSPMVVWDHESIQTHYQIQVLNMSDLVLWDTGQVTGTAVSSKIGFYLDNLTNYKVQVRIRNSEGLWSNFGTSIFQTNYKYPAPASIDAIAKDGYITVSYENGVPTGEQPNTVRNEVYKYIDSEWIKMADGYTFTFDDYSVPNDVTVYYYIRSYAENGAYTDSEVVSAKIQLTGVVLYLVNNPVSTRKQFKRVIERQNDWSIESVSMRFKGRRRPVKEVGTLEDDVISFSLRLNEDEKRALDDIVYSGQIVCYRDGNGRLGYGIFDKYPLVDLPNGEYEVSLELEEIDYSEGTPKLEDDDGVINVIIDGGEYY